MAKSQFFYSDRFFISFLRPEFYTHLGVEWVMDNGSDGKIVEEGRPKGYEVDVSPLKRVLPRDLPELVPGLTHAVKAFDPWRRNRGQHYSLDWTPRPNAKENAAFQGR